MKFENISSTSNIKATKKQLQEALFLLLDEVLPKMECSLIDNRGNYKCNRCDKCMYNQLLFRVKNREKSYYTKSKEKVGEE